MTFGYGDTAIAYGYDSVDVLTVSKHDSGNEWVLDSGYSYHMCPNKDWFATYQTLKGER